MAEQLKLSADLGKDMLAEVDWRHPAVEPTGQVEIEQLCVSVFFICRSNILWAGDCSTVLSQSLECEGSKSYTQHWKGS